jgi:hypothetical protein
MPSQSVPELNRWRRLLETERGDAQRADAVFTGEGDHPAVAARHVDDLAIHAQLLEIAGRAARAVRNGLTRAQHANRHGERLRTDIELQLVVRALHVDHRWFDPPGFGAV